MAYDSKKLTLGNFIATLFFILLFFCCHCQALEPKLQKEILVLPFLQMFLTKVVYYFFKYNINLPKNCNELEKFNKRMSLSFSFYPIFYPLNQKMRIMPLFLS